MRKPESGRAARHTGKVRAIPAIPRTASVMRRMNIVTIDRTMGHVGTADASTAQLASRSGDPPRPPHAGISLVLERGTEGSDERR